ncbi:MAG: 5-formyltetrahydrofolate cyclo-ligase [Faecousia sp.]
MKQNKQAVRSAIRAKKQALDQQEIARRSVLLCQRVLRSPAYQSAHSIYGYVPFNQEVDILPLLHRALADGKQVALPKCDGREMRFLCVSDLTRVQYTARGVPEPADDAPVARDESALVIVPGLAFDCRGYRIGYGGGYYDRFLAKEPGHPTIALCYDFQLLDRLEPDPYDVPVDTIFSI